MAWGSACQAKQDRLICGVLVGREVPVWPTAQPQIVHGGRTSAALVRPNDMNVQTLLIQQQ